jgi:hypothetical protein
LPLIAVIGEQTVDLLFQGWQIILDGVPDHVPIHVEVFMNYLVAHAAHLKPRQFRMIGDKRGGHVLNMVRGLAGDFNITNHGILRSGVLLERLGVFETLNVARGALNGLSDVFQIVFDPFGMLHKG